MFSGLEELAGEERMLGLNLTKKILPASIKITFNVFKWQKSFAGKYSALTFSPKIYNVIKAVIPAELWGNKQ